MAYYSSLKEIEVDIHNLQREPAKRLVIDTIKESRYKNISTIKFITGRGNHINSIEERGVLCEAFPSWMSDTEIKHLIEHCKKYDGYYLVYLDFERVYLNYFLNFNFIEFFIHDFDYKGCLITLFLFIITFIFTITITIILFLISYILIVAYARSLSIINY
ncbi:hypothetical protein GLOIN_2v1530036 [Rhizophagus clarus]|uniref:Smr domain-containing protein n=1 Tax=Rhizophagus clarus TaxID=94130 RepID=A0A8H3QCC6_9GLOM|nr:hypothetical protein GLOIN_2v1530036 [Rhizophagus clarus]